MSNQYLSDIEQTIEGPLEDLKQGRCDIVIIRLRVTRKEIEGQIRKGKFPSQTTKENEEYKIKD